MDQPEMDALLHELRCRNECGLKISGQILALRALWDDVDGEVDMLRTTWGDNCPPKSSGIMTIDNSGHNKY